MAEISAYDFILEIESLVVDGQYTAAAELVKQRDAANARSVVEDLRKQAAANTALSEHDREVHYAELEHYVERIEVWEGDSLDEWNDEVRAYALRAAYHQILGLAGPDCTEHDAKLLTAAANALRDIRGWKEEQEEVKP